MNDVVSQLFARGRLIGLPTGFHTLDNYCGGLRDGTATLLVASTGVGKTILALNILVSLLKSGTPCAYYDLENGETETLSRLLAIWFALPQDYFLDTSNQTDAESKVEEITENLTYWSDDDLQRFETKELKGVDLILKLMRVELFQKKTKFFLIDPLQALETSLDAQYSYNEQGDIVKKFKQFAQHNKVPIMLLHHMRKPTAGSGQKMKAEDIDDPQENDYYLPTLESIKGSSKITDTATDVWGMARSYGSSLEPDQGKTILRILKSRSGKRGDVKLNLDLTTLTFLERDVPDSITYKGKTPNEVLVGPLD